MTPALEAHLQRLFILSLRVEALAGALNSIIDEPVLIETSVEIAQALSAMATTLSEGLDNPQNFEVAP